MDDELAETVEATVSDVDEQPVEDLAEQPVEDPAEDLTGDLVEEPTDEPSDGLEAPVTGDAAVDEATSRLARMQGATLEEQLPVLEAVHRTLQDRLADVEG